MKHRPDDSGLPKGKEMAAPLGNTNSSKNNRLWADTIRRACVQADGAALREIADRLLEKAREGDIQAMKEIGDRLDGKAAQSIAVSGTGDDGAVLIQTIRRVIVDPKP